jgi:hypothetical protein
MGLSLHQQSLTVEHDHVDGQSRRGKRFAALGVAHLPDERLAQPVFIAMSRQQAGKRRVRNPTLDAEAAAAALQVTSESFHSTQAGLHGQHADEDGVEQGREAPTAPTTCAWVHDGREVGSVAPLAQESPEPLDADCNHRSSLLVFGAAAGKPGRQAVTRLSASMTLERQRSGLPTGSKLEVGSPPSTLAA